MIPRAALTLQQRQFALCGGQHDAQELARSLIGRFDQLGPEAPDILLQDELLHAARENVPAGPVSPAPNLTKGNLTA